MLPGSSRRRLRTTGPAVAASLLFLLYLSRSDTRPSLSSLHELQNSLQHAWQSAGHPTGETAPLVVTSLKRRIFHDPAPVPLDDNIELVFALGSITDQRSTWGEGGRPPWYVRMLLYENPKDHERSQGQLFLLRINASYPAYPDVGDIRCRPYSAHSNWWPIREVMSYDGLYRLECDLPESIVDANSAPPSSLAIELTYDALFINDTVRDEVVELQNQQGPHHEWPDHPELRSLQARQQIQLDTVHVAKTKYTICLFPFWGYDNYVGDKDPLRFIEWRLYWQKLGVDRVVWYAYEGEPRYLVFIRALTAQLGNRDEVQVVARMPHPFLLYWDQALYYNHCGQIYRDATEIFVIVDLDEVLALDPVEYDDPAAGLSRWIDTWDPLAGSYMMLRVDLGVSEETFERGRPEIDELAQDVWTTANLDASVIQHYHRKTLYRAKSVQEIWTHHGTWMYPRPVPANESLVTGWPEWPKPYQNWDISWNQIPWETPGTNPANYSESTWPRMYHYRWWGGSDSDFGVADLPSHPNLRAFQETLRDEVVQVGAAVRKRLGPANMLANARGHR